MSKLVQNSIIRFTAILARLLDSYSDNVYCLVRSKNNMSPESRLSDTLQFYFGNKYDNVIGSRVIVINGDITNY